MSLNPALTVTAMASAPAVATTAAPTYVWAPPSLLLAAALAAITTPHNATNTFTVAPTYTHTWCVCLAVHTYLCKLCREWSILFCSFGSFNYHIHFLISLSSPAQTCCCSFASATSSKCTRTLVGMVLMKRWTINNIKLFQQFYIKYFR